jgi:phosphoketolase
MLPSVSLCMIESRSASSLVGGKLGYSLSYSFGAVLDHPELVVACVVGDGEAETGPLATAWHSNKFLNRPPTARCCQSCVSTATRFPTRPYRPMIVLNSPKGWTGPKNVDAWRMLRGCV